MKDWWNSERTKRRRYAIRLYLYLAANGATWLSFRGCQKCYDQREGKYEEV